MESILSMKTFHDKIEEQLAVMDVSELQELIRSFAGEIKPAERKQFLGKLNPSCKKAVLHDDLLDEIEGLIEEIKSCFEEEPDWEEYDPHCEEAQPDEESIEAVSLFFERVNAIFDNGNAELARKAYEKLFAVFDLDDEYGREIHDYDLEDVDMKEVRARYLRSIYLCTEKNDIPSVLLHKIRRMRYLFCKQRPSLSEIIEISSDPLPDWNAFLNSWIDFLKNKEDPCAKALLREAILLRDGVTGLKQLSESQGMVHPRLFYDLINQYSSNGEKNTALAEAKNALKLLPQGLSIRASIADQMIALAKTLNDQEALLNGMWVTFHENPDLKKLLELFLHTPQEQRQQKMQEALEVIDKRIKMPKERENDCDRWENDSVEEISTPTRSLPVHACFFARKQDRPSKLVFENEKWGWIYGEQLQPLYIGICFFHALPATTLKEMPSNFKRFWMRYLFGKSSEYLFQHGNEMEGKITEAYEELKRTVRWSPDQKLLQRCFANAKKTVFSIVETQQRREYHLAAMITATCHDVLKALGRSNDATSFYMEIKNAFPRHSSFQQKLKEMRKE